MSKARDGLVPKTGAERVAALRLARDALGLKRLELYAHPDDWPAIKTLSARLLKKRAKAAAVLDGLIDKKQKT